MPLPTNRAAVAAAAGIGGVDRIANRDGTIPASEADDIFICVGVFIHWLAEDDKKIQDFNYRAVKESIKRAVNREPSVASVLDKKSTMAHPFQAAA